MGLPFVPNEPAAATKWVCHCYQTSLPQVPNGPAISTKWQTRFGLFRLWVDDRSAKDLNLRRRNLQNWENRFLRAGAGSGIICADDMPFKAFSARRGCGRAHALP